MTSLLVPHELKVLDYWEKKGINGKVREKNRGKKKFYFLDGPPYVTGDLHPGQMWVKTVKDIFLRYKRYRGFDVRDRAGYDVHGLPIENKVEKQLGILHKKDIETKVGIEEFTRKCREYVDSFMGRMDKDYIRFGMSLNFANPYLAYRSEFIETAWEIFKRISDNGFLYKGKKTTAFCTHCETALAQGSMEVSYSETEDPSIFVAFRVDAAASRCKIAVGERTHLLIWTTTPWTLPANVSVAANPKALYVLADAGGRELIFAKQRLEAVEAGTNESLIIKEEFYGSELEGLRYVSPLEDDVPAQREMREHHRVVFSEELVSMEEGTGLVHIAPGHGLDDYNLGVKNKLPVFSPVGQGGTYTEEAGKYAGLAVPGQANTKVMHDLKALGALLGSGTIRHSYPQCWRCDTKLIYIATEQWFFDVQKCKDNLTAENSKVSWHPPEARGWLDDVIRASPDWCVSRQRYWGIPLPIWGCKNCGTTKIIGSLRELRAGELETRGGPGLEDLHRPHIDKIIVKCPNCGGGMKRVPDVLDVWFDASIAFRASMTREEFDRMFPVDYILEGKDQLRGWFSYLLKASVMAYGSAPYRHVGVDGMLLDEHGREMHKKLGNYVGLEEIAKDPGADVFRLWCADHTPWLDLNWNREELRDAGKAIMILDNISNLINEYGEAAGYKRGGMPPLPAADGLRAEDRWILSSMESTIEKVTACLDDYRAFDAAEAIRGFITEDFSRFYLKLAKRRMTYGDADEAGRILGISSHLLFRSLVAISPITPFIAERIYLRDYGRLESIFLEDWPVPDGKLMDKGLEAEMEVVKEAATALLGCRERAGVSLRWPIARETLEVGDDFAYSALERLSDVLESYTNAKRLELRRVSGGLAQVRPMFAKLGPDFKARAGEVAEALRVADVRELEAAIAKHGSYLLHTPGGAVEIRAEHFTVVRVVEGRDAVPFKYGTASIDEKMSRELAGEAMVREFERRVQMLRRELGLKKADPIVLGLSVQPSGAVAKAIQGDREGVMRRLNVSKMSDTIGKDGLCKKFEIEGETVNVSVEKGTKE